MDLQLLFKTAKAFVFSNNQRVATETEDFLNLKGLEELTSPPADFPIFAEVPERLGRSEKFSRKKRIDEVLTKLQMVQDCRTLNEKFRESESSACSPLTPLSVGHFFHKKVVSPFAPGVVRVKTRQIQSPLKPRPPEPTRASNTPQPVNSYREVRRQDEGEPSSIAEGKTKQRLSSSSRFISARESVNVFQIIKNEGSKTRYLKIANPAKTNKFISNHQIKPMQITKSPTQTTKKQPVKPAKEPQSPSPIKALISEPSPLSSYSQDEITKFTGSTLHGHKDGFCEIEYKSGNSFKGYLKKDKKSGPGVFHYSKVQAKYKGEFFDDLPNGQGKLKLETGEFIKTTFKSGKIVDGLTLMRFQDQTSYEGKAENGKRSGDGKLEYSETTEYFGKWENDQRSGRGFIQSGDSFKFEGLFKNDYTDGPGVLVVKTFSFPESKSKKNEDILRKPEIQNVLQGFTMNFSQFSKNHSIFIAVPGKVLENLLQKSAEDGKFVGGRLNGAGIAKYGCFGTFVGTFKDGKRSGFGKMVYCDPSRMVAGLGEMLGEYVGSFKDNKRHGPGQMTWPGGLVFKGSFSQDRRHQGQLFFKNGEVYQGTWIDDKLEGLCKLFKRNMTVHARFFRGNMNGQAFVQFHDGRTYEGSLVNLTPHGNGRMKWPSAKVFQGEFCDGVIDGVGRMTYPNGDVYEGTWENGKRAGRGSMNYFTTGKRYEGEWMDDFKSGEGILKDIQTGEVIFDGFWNHDEVVN